MPLSMDLLLPRLCLPCLTFDDAVGRHLKTDLDGDILSIFGKHQIKSGLTVISGTGVSHARNVPIHPVFYTGYAHMLRDILLHKPLSKLPECIGLRPARDTAHPQIALTNKFFQLI